MQFPNFQTCCYCCSLRNGTISIGVLSLIILNWSLFISGLPTGGDKNEKKSSNSSSISNSSSVESSEESSLVTVEAFIIVCVMELSSILLIIGAAKKFRKLFWPWMVAYSVSFGAWAVSSIFNLFFPHEKSNEEEESPVAYALFSILFFALYVYFILIVYSYFKELRAEEKGELEQAEPEPRPTEL